ncbi:hypothetical protein MPER_12026 [Moniliophthora perniciosa FA553]|nr:hypothetical protein MPER_12026 [Moniliophthora perniciosa FA553]
MPIPRQAKAPIPNPYYSHAYPTPSATPIPDNGAVTLPRPRQPNANPYLPNIVPSTPVVGATNHSSAHAANKLPSSVNGTSSHAGTFPAPKPGVPVNPIVHNPNRPNQHPAIRPQRVHHTNQFPAIHRQYPQRVHLVNIAGKMTRIVPKNTNIKALLAPLPNRTTIDPRLLLFRAHGVQKQDPSPSVQEALAALYGDAPPRDRVSEENLEYFLTRLDGKDALGNVWTGSRLAAMMLAA